MFCSACGTQQPDGTNFCGVCGAKLGAPAPQAPQPQPVQPPPQAPPPPQYQQSQPYQQPQQQYSQPQQYPPPGYQPYGQPPPPAQSSTPWGKIILFIVGGIFLLGAIGVGTAVYIAYKAKNYVTEQAKERGIDLEKIGERKPGAEQVEPCSLLTEAEASEILGVKIERSDSQDSRACRYYAPASAEQKTEDTDANSPQEEALKGILGDAIGEGSYVGLAVDWDNGIASMLAVRIALEAFGGMRLQKIPGIGDEAILGVRDSILMFTKGGTSVLLDLRKVPAPREKGIAIARKIESRLHLK